MIEFDNVKNSEDDSDDINNDLQKEKIIKERISAW